MCEHSADDGDDVKKNMVAIATREFCIEIQFACVHKTYIHLCILIMNMFNKQLKQR